MSNDMTTEREQWESVIRHFLKNKSDMEEEKYLKDSLKAVANAFDKSKWFGDQSIKDFFDAKKNKKSEDQTALAFQQQKWQQAKTLNSQPSSLNWGLLDANYQAKVVDLNEKYSAADWIAKASQNASSVSFATHVVKLTHSKIDTPSFLDQVDAINPAYLSTSSLSEKVLDGAVAGNQFAPIYQFLELESQGVKLAQELSDDTSEALRAFVRSDEELQHWNSCFKQASISDDMATHALLKQIYFPLNIRGDYQYHLLSQVVSSSLAQNIFERLFNDQQKQIRALCDKEKFSIGTKITFPRRANISVTASNHSNASQLNGKRGGKLHLLSTQSPTWQRQVKPPIYQTSWFRSGIPNYAVKEDIQYLREFLLRNDAQELSTRDPKRRKWLVNWGEQIVDEVMYHANIIQTLPAGWSAVEDIKLKKAHQCFLDPYRDDEGFQSERESTDWETEICADFARWLNNHLKGKDNAFTPEEEHSKLWKKLMSSALSELKDTQKFSFEKEANA